MKITNTEKKTLLYAALFIAGLLNARQLLNIRLSDFVEPEGVIIGIPWRYDFLEMTYQATFHFIFCALFGYINLRLLYRSAKEKSTNWLQIIMINLLIFFVLGTIGIFSQKYFFQNIYNDSFFKLAYLVRLFISIGLMSILVKILILQRKQRIKEIENEKLKTAYYNAELNNLRAQLNPHFLFNSLSSLSALIREKPVKAQEYVAHLSKVFRDSLSHNDKQLVDLNKEVELLNSNIELLRMRFEDALVVNINLNGIKNEKIPHMSLQPLLENTLKHNHVSSETPIYVDLFIEGDKLVFKNSMVKPKFKEPSTGIGLLNLNERYKILVDKEIEIYKTDTHFVVKLPLI